MLLSQNILPPKVYLRVTGVKSRFPFTGVLIQLLNYRLLNIRKLCRPSKTAPWEQSELGMHCLLVFLKVFLKTT